MLRIAARTDRMDLDTIASTHIIGKPLYYSEVLMAKVTVDAGICGFTTTITTTSDDGSIVAISYESECPHVIKAKDELTNVDAYEELFRKPAETAVYQALAKHLPHVTCPLYSGFLKAVEVAAGMALPKDVSMTIEK